MNSKLILGEDGETVGINLGADFTAEHEWGIKRIKSALGIPETVDRENAGLAARTISSVPEGYLFYEKGATHSCLTFAPAYYVQGWENRELDSSPKEIATAWDGESFGMVLKNTDSFVAFLDRLHDSFQKKDIAVWLGGAEGLIANAGLVIVVASAVPVEAREVMRKSDLSYLDLEDAVKATNIRKILKEAEKDYYALSPRWKDEEAGEVIYWLNPMDQRNNNFGWFTLQDLLDWAKGEGPIPMQ